MSSGGTSLVTPRSPLHEIELLLSAAQEHLDEADRRDIEASCAKGSPGLVVTDTETLKKQHGVIASFARQIGVNILQGKNIMNVSLPVTLFEPRSMLQRVVEYYRRPDLLDAAAAAATPLARFKLVCAFVVSGLHRVSGNCKPFNPILGETFEARVGGARVFAEQTLHHPPVSTVLLAHAARAWRLRVSANMSAKFAGNSVRARQKGSSHLEFATRAPSGFASEAAWTYPLVVFHGLAFGQRWGRYAGTLVVRDVSAGLYLQATFNAKPKKGLPLPFRRRAHAPPAHAFRGGIFRTDPDALRADPEPEAVNARVARGDHVYPGSVLVAEAHGSFLGTFVVDGEVLWSISEPLEPISPVPLADSLPSDCRFRPDLICLAQSRLSEADKGKRFLEEMQRRDRALRAGEHPSHVPIPHYLRPAEE
eukprot:gnl/Chilomastix_cuspidata/4042.p1 GENE.gnl/Chilomastix_cuspidata/4042~~gnl/Chilomastix_cuspidata/4042.p1  ORF type:complete len:422 (+),score=169.64 gnl/Chilomastix_cuspidata/4042:860-2125(+)